ncbi:MAG: hypothetical protein WC776_00385 [Patescibacteria group bacterium]|jgi:hypothetical protein
MQNVLKNGKRALSVAVATATMLFSVGAGLLQPSVAAAASAGDLIKGTSLSTVYYYGYDGMRYTFPNEKTFMTWYSDFSDVTTISDSSLADLSLAGNVVYRPGSYWIKVLSMNQVYAVGTDGAIHWIESEDAAVDFAGSDWNSRIQDVPDVFFTDYTEGTSLMTATAFDGMLYMDGGNYYISKGGEKRMVSSAGRSANNLQTSFFLTGTGIDDSSLSAGTDITSGLTSIMDVAQTETDEATVTGGVSISLASTSPAAATIPDAAAGVEVATFKMTADEAATVDVMYVALSGLAATSTISSNGVYLYEGSERLTDGKSFNSSTRKATFGSLGLDFGAGETRYITVVVDMANAGLTTNFAVGLEGASDVEAGGDVSGSFPITGNTMSVVNSDVGSITITDTGSLTNPVIGANDATISYFKLAAGATEDISVERITLKIDDSADHSDFQLWQNNEWIADGSYIGNKLVMFDLGSNAYGIDKGSDRTFEVTADIGGNAADALNVYLDNSADLYAVGSDYGYGVTVTRTGFDGTTGDLSTTTIQGGELSVAFSGPASSDVGNTTQNFSLFEGTLTAERAMTITAMPMNLAMTNDDSTGLETDPISDIRIVNADTGDLIMGPLDLASTDADDTAEVLSFTDDFDMAAGEVLNFMVIADMESTYAEASDTFTISMDLTSGLTAEDSDGDAITDIVPTANLDGNAQTVVVSGLTVSLASTPTGTKTYVRGTSDVEVVAFNFAAASGGDINVTAFSPTVEVDHDGGGTFVAGTDSTTISTERIVSCSLYDGSDLIDGPRSIASATTGKINFEDFSYTVSAGTTQTVTIKCNLANIDPGTADLFAWAMLLPADLTALDTEGDSATVTGTDVNIAPTMIISVANTGSLAVTAASDAPVAAFLMTGSNDNSVSKFRFSATSEAFTVNRLTVEEAQGTADTEVAARYANNVSLVTLSYPDVNGTTQTATGALTGSAITFNDLTFYVGKDSRADVTVKVNVPTTDRSGGSATSNEKVRMVLDDGTGELRAVGAGSNQTINDSTITGVDAAGALMNKFVVRETKPTITLSSSSPSGAGKTPGNQETLRFNVAAASGEDVVLNNLVFTFSASDNAGSDWNQCDTDITNGTLLYASGADFKLYNLTEDASATTALAGTYSLLKSTGAACDSDDADVNFVKLALTTAEVIPAGESMVYSVWFNSDTASSNNDDSVQLGLASDPITSTYLNVSNAANDADIAITATTVNVDSGAAFAVGDVINMDVDDSGVADSDEEKMLITAIDTNALTVIRGYLGSTVEAADADADSDDYEVTDDIQRLPGALLWQDDGSTAVTSSTQEYYGSHLINGFTGYGISF